MPIIVRKYRPSEDFQPIGDFLVRHYRADNRDGNWLQPMWEYMHSHPGLDESALGRIDIWEDGGEMVGAAHYESTPGEVFFQVHPAYAHLKAEMLDYAERSLLGTTPGGRGYYLEVFVNDFDAELRALVVARGYQRAAEKDRPLSQLVIPTPFPKIELPDAFNLKSLAQDNDLHKIHRVLWRGFNHEGEPPPEGIEGRKKMQSVPNFRYELNIVVEAPSGHFVAYAGTWFEPTNRYAYVEPVATDPEFRRLGLGRAAVLEALRRCAELGATVAYVGSAQPFYLALGFAALHASQCWRKELQR